MKNNARVHVKKTVAQERGEITGVTCVAFPKLWVSNQCTVDCDMIFPAVPQSLPRSHF